MRVSIETSNPELLLELIQKENNSLDKHIVDTIFFNTHNPSLTELLNYIRTLWSINDKVYINVFSNIVLFPQYMINNKKYNQKDYAIYKHIFNSKNCLPSVVILLYDDETSFIENVLNDPLFNIRVYKVQLSSNHDDIVKSLNDILSIVFSNYIDDNSQFRYFEQCYSNYNRINQ